MVTKKDLQTKGLARDLISQLKVPTVLALVGDLGAGKTTFVQGLAEGLEIKKRVLSPTFVFLRSYKLQINKFKTFHHFDLYRCASLADVKNIGLLEILEEKDSLVAIEWPEIAKDLLPEHTKWIKIKKINDSEREIEIS